jgi:O-acetyl-ADP-ribose deacetylase (regulator of RNase III)
MTVTVLKNTNAIDKLFQLQYAGVECFLLHVVNCQGVMGSGIALEIKNRIPRAYDKYIKSGPILGSLSVSEGVINMAAQWRYGTDKRYLNYGALARCLDLISLKMDVKTTIIVPYKMGCDRAGGDWEVVLEMLDFMFADVIVCKLN